MDSIRGFFRGSLVIIQVPLDFPLRSQGFDLVILWNMGSFRRNPHVFFQEKHLIPGTRWAQKLVIVEVK